MVKGVIFDMDGTMFDTERISTITWNLVSDKYGMDIPESLVDDFRGRNRKSIRQKFQEYYGDRFVYDEVVKHRHAMMWEIIDRDGVPVKEGLYELLRFLKEEGIRVAIATSTEKERAEEFMRRTQIIDYFHAGVFGPEVTKSKPNPEIFLAAAEKLGLDPKECLVLEDSTNGVLAGKAAGGYTIYIPDEAKVAEATKEGITAEVEDLSRVIDWIKKENHSCENA